MPDHDVLTLGGAKSTLRSTLSRAMAEALVNGIDQAAQEGAPLTMNQQMHVATMTVMAYHTAVETGEAALRAEVELRKAGLR